MNPRMKLMSTIRLAGYTLCNKGERPGKVELSDIEMPGGAEAPRRGLTLFYGFDGRHQISLLMKAASIKSEELYPIFVEIGIRPITPGRAEFSSLKNMDFVDLSFSDTALKDWVVKHLRNDNYAAQEENVFINGASERFITRYPERLSRLFLDPELAFGVGAVTYNVPDRRNKPVPVTTIFNRDLITKISSMGGNHEIVIPDKIPSFAELGLSVTA